MVDYEGLNGMVTGSLHKNTDKWNDYLESSDNSVRMIAKEMQVIT